ncbi:MAG: Aminopeptidase 2 mitochondrial [Peltula sp. TS41687]|nr:MAG: Aminopeptidase 2 mitochondrial [Peltula sp. TS41687]
MCKRDIEAGTAEMGLDVSKGRELLPANVKPVHYAVTLEPNFDDFTYEGTVTIDLDVKEDTTSITLNTLELEIHQTIIRAGSAVNISNPKLEYDEKTQRTSISLDQKLPAGSEAQLVLTFKGLLNDKLVGFYRSSYTDSASGKTKYLAVTQFEPTDARRAIPCFDEPSLKATFDVELIADKHLTCLSNMDVALEREVDTRSGVKKAVKFNRTPLMSTYLLAFVVGELNYIETNAFRIPLRVYATPDKNVEHGKYALDLSARTLDLYEKTFDSKFPLPKMDLIAVPDLGAGAMENWGLVTFRLVQLLYDESKSPASTKERIAEYVTHELAHQWFGNLVTMDFWDGLWLNEGFATFMSWFACNSFHPEWKVWQSYVTGTLQEALSLDALRSSHPIEVPVKRADEINQIFDAISYSKGSCVLRMLSTFLSEDAFFEGVRRYLKKHAYGNTETGDLWAALSDASGKDVRKAMEIWTKAVGYPIITVTEDEGSSKIHVKQNRFLRTGDVKAEEDTTLYPVFLELRTRSGVNNDLLLEGREKDIQLPDLDFFKLNADHAGIYRTSYTPARLTKLGAAAKEGLLTVEDRTGMIADAGALAASGYQKSSGLLALLKSFEVEPDFVVWNEILIRVSSVRNAWLFEDSHVLDGLRAFQRGLVSDKAHKMGWAFHEGEDHIQQQFKDLLFGSAGMVGDKTIVQAAFDMFDKFSQGDRKAIDPNIRSSVYRIVLRYGGQKEASKRYDAVLNEFRNADSSEGRYMALGSLGLAEGEDLIQRTLALAMSDEVKSQDTYRAIGSLRSHKAGVEALWRWLQESWPVLEEKYEPGGFMLSSIVQICTSNYAKPGSVEDIQRFFRDRSTTGFDQALAQALDTVKAKVSWVQRDRDDVKEWVKANGYL